MWRGRRTKQASLPSTSPPPPLQNVFCFLLQQLLFARLAPAIAAHVAVFAHDTMAGNGNSDGVGGAGIRHSASGSGLANALRNLAIRTGLAVRYSLQCLPDAPLKSRRLHIKRQIKVWLLAVEMPHQRLDPIVQGCAIH